MKMPNCVSDPFDLNRRQFLHTMANGMAGIAVQNLLLQDNASASEEHFRPPDGKAHYQPKAKNVIWLFMFGGVSHLESFDPKPALSKYDGMELGKTGYKSTFDGDKVRSFVAGNKRHLRTKLYGLQTGFKKYGQSGIEVSDWFPKIGGCIDDIAVIRSMWTTDNDHGAQLQFHTGKHVLDGIFPSIGSWVSYGLGSLNENLPQFVVLGEMPGSCCGGKNVFGANYLGPQYDGVQVAVDPKNPLPFASPTKGLYHEEQKREFELLKKLNNIAAKQYPRDSVMQARIKSYELAFRMQAAVPQVVNYEGESQATQTLYGLDQKECRRFGEQLLVTRRLVEKGVRFVQVFHGAGGAGSWDSHKDLQKNHSKLAMQTDRPIAGLLTDLKQRGILDETIVVWATEFGRTPGSEGGSGRDHHPMGFSVWMAGGGIKGGITHGATDELGVHAVENRHYVTDIHATVMHLLGLDPRRLAVPGRQRLEMDYGHTINEILA